MRLSLLILLFRGIFVRTSSSTTLALEPNAEEKEIQFEGGLSNQIIAGRRIQDTTVDNLDDSSTSTTSSDDFDRLNELLENVVIGIDDDMTISEKVGFINLDMVVESLSCRDIRIGDIVLNHSTDESETTTTVIDVDLALNGVDAACDIEYKYEYGFLKGSGTAEIVTKGNAADTSMRFITGNDSPVTFSVTNCIVNVEISDVNFKDADFASSLIGIFEKPLRDLFEKEIEGYACTELSTSGVTFLNDDLFLMIDDTLEGYTTSVDDTGLFDESTLFPDNYDINQALNFRQISETQIGTLFNRALSELDQLLGNGSGSGNDNDNDNELGINNVLRSYVLDENKALVVNVEQLLGMDGINLALHDNFTETNISLEEVRIYGLDSMTKFDPLVIFGNYTLRNEFSWEFLQIEIDLSVDIQPSSLETSILKDSTDNGSVQKGITEDITIKFGAENIDVTASIFALIDVEALGGLTIGSLLSLTNTEDYSWLLPCLTSSIRALQFTELKLSAEQIQVPTLEGFVDDGLDRVISNIAELAFDMYGDILVEDVLPNVFQSTVKNFVNDQIATILVDEDDSSNACPDYDEISAGDSELYVDFREFFDSSFSTTSNEYGEVPSILRSLMDKQLLETDPSTGMPKINEVLVDSLTRGQSGTEGTLIFDGDGTDLFSIKQRINVGGLDADVRISASYVKIENLDTIMSPLMLLEPVSTEPYFLNNSVTIGTEERPVKLSTNFAFAVIDEVGGTEISNEIDISLDMYTANVLMTLMLKVAKSKLLGFPLVDMFDPYCWIATIPPPTLNEQGVSVDDEVMAAVVDFAASVANLNLNLNCVQCSSPGIIELTETLTSSGEAQNDVTDLVNLLLLPFVTDLIKGDVLQVQIDRLLNDADKKCRHSPNYDPNFRQLNYASFELPEAEASTTYLMLLGVVSAALLLLVAVLALSIRYFTQRRHTRWLSMLPVEQLEALKQIQRSEDSLQLALNSTTRSMFQSDKDIPFLIRYGMPVIILGNIGLFLSGHLSLGATVNIEAQIAGETISVDTFFEFSMAKSTIDIWMAGGKELAILILVFSGIWPYTKQLMTLALWFTPTSWVPISRRGSILIWLDRLAKWSMIDIFVLIISLAAFRVSVNSPSNVAFLPDNFYSLDLLVVPLWGLYANLIAQLVSQISSHCIIHYHRRIENNALDSYDDQNSSYRPPKTSENSDKKVTFRTHRFGRPHRGETEKLVVRNWVNHVLTSAVMVLIACIIAGCILPSFSVEVFGLLGVAVESGQEFRDANTNHSVFTVIKMLLEEAQFIDTIRSYIGLVSFSVVFALTVLVVPILQSIALLVLWFIPMSTKQQTKISVLVEILQAWQYVEVYIIAVFVASWQLGPISSFMVNSYCGSLDGFFSELVFYGILKDEDAQCFSVLSSIEGGFYVLAAGAILLALVNSFVTKATKQYSRDQVELYRQSPTEDHTEELEDGKEIDVDNADTTIHPVPVLFTDTFRWLLERDEDEGTNSQDSSRQDPSSTAN